MRVGLVVIALAALAACGDGRQPGGVIAPETVDAALRLCMDGEADTAIAQLDTALMRVPGSIDGLTTRGLCYWTRGDATGEGADAQRAYDDLTAAIDGYESGGVTTTTPLDRIYSHRAFVARTLDPGDWKRTLADLDAAIDIAPGDPVHALDRAVVHTAAGDTTAARTDLRRVLALTDSAEADRRAFVERMLADLDPPGR